jgi:RNA polymerase sigma-70 factor (ECF subfamily)
MTPTSTRKPAAADRTNGLLDRIARNDHEALQECIVRYGPLVNFLARRSAIGAARNDLEDAVQEIFIAIWQNAGRFDRTRASEKTFVAMIAKRRLIDRHRKETRRAAAHSMDGEWTADMADESFAPTSVWSERPDVSKALARLEPRQRHVLELSVIYGKPLRAIARATGMPLGTVKSTIRRALIRMRTDAANGVAHGDVALC